MTDKELKGRSFEKALADLERVVSGLESGQLGLDEALAHYELGVRLVRHCQAGLQEVEQRILALQGLEANGAPRLVPFAHEASAPRRSARSGARPSAANEESSPAEEVKPRRRTKRGEPGEGLFAE